MDSIYKIRASYTFGLLLISLVIALSAVELLSTAFSTIEPESPIKETVTVIYKMKS